MTPPAITVAIPTYGRDDVLVSTLVHLLPQVAPHGSLLLADQTPEHRSDVLQQLRTWDATGVIRWMRLPRPSIPRAMNALLHAATTPLVLFLDDDVEPAEGLIAAHVAAYRDDTLWAVAGQVLQPGETPVPAPAHRTRGGLLADLDFPFASREPAVVSNVMAGNLSVRRDQALAAGGFDQNFAGVAYRFETEFCRRLLARGGRVVFEPAAAIRHCRAPRGGTRRFGSHLTSPLPAHGVGDYYFALRCGTPLEALRYILHRPFREIRTRFHLSHPWWIPVKLLGEVLALGWALALAARGPRCTTPIAPRHQTGVQP